jgi:hypothetical protein
MSKPTQFREDLMILATILFVMAAIAFDVFGAWLTPTGTP